VVRVVFCSLRLGGVVLVLLVFYASLALALRVFLLDGTKKLCAFKLRREPMSSTEYHIAHLRPPRAPSWTAQNVYAHAISIGQLWVKIFEI
jgi:hypothetical protein